MISSLESGSTSIFRLSQNLSNQGFGINTRTPFLIVDSSLQLSLLRAFKSTKSTDSSSTTCPTVMSFSAKKQGTLVPSVCLGVACLGSELDDAAVDILAVVLYRAIVGCHWLHSCPNFQEATRMPVTASDLMIQARCPKPVPTKPRLGENQTRNQGGKRSVKGR